MSSIENGHALATVEHALPQMVTGVEAVRAAMAELRAIRTFVKEEMVEGLDYGKPFAAKEGDPNVKDCLLQPGAQKIAMLLNAYRSPRSRQPSWGTGMSST